MGPCASLIHLVLVCEQFQTHPTPQGGRGEPHRRWGKRSGVPQPLKHMFRGPGVVVPPDVMCSATGR